MSEERCEYCGQEERYGHNAVCVMNTVEELRAEIEQLKLALARARCFLRDGMYISAVGVITQALAAKDTKP